MEEINQDPKPIDWDHLEELAQLWATTRKFPEDAARDYWHRSGLLRGTWEAGANVWGTRK